MTKAEQANLLRLGKLNRDGAIAEARRHTAEAAADFAMRLAARFSFDQRDAWAELMRTAKSHVSEIDHRLAADCARLGIPAAFRPSIDICWFSRGENASKERRAELQRVHATRLIAIERAAIEEIMAGHRRFETKVLTATISTDEGLEQLATMPTAEQLMPRINYESIQRSLLEGPEATALRSGLSIADERGGGDGEDGLP
jgi:hypothetical protein